MRLTRPFDDSKVAERHFIATASCGICGKASIDEVALRVDPIPVGRTVPRTVILALPDLLRAAQRAFDETGGLHAAGLFKPAGELLALREDVGRHNALDKLVGSQVLAKAMPLHDRIVMVSGRVSFEIIQKAAVAGVADRLRGVGAVGPRHRYGRPARRDARRVPARRRLQRLHARQPDRPARPLGLGLTGRASA